MHTVFSSKVRQRFRWISLLDGHGLAGRVLKRPFSWGNYGLTKMWIQDEINVIMDIYIYNEYNMNSIWTWRKIMQILNCKNNIENDGFGHWVLSLFLDHVAQRIASFLLGSWQVGLSLKEGESGAWRGSPAVSAKMKGVPKLSFSRN